jgi:hypothetical protein
VTFIRQLAGLKFEGLVCGEKGHLGHPSIVAGSVRGQLIIAG